MKIDSHNPTLEALMDRWEAQREVQNLMGRMTYCYIVKKESEILNSYWSAGEDICLGINTGYFKGRDAVASYYDNMAERNILTAKLMQKKFPDQLGKMTDNEIYGIGTLEVKPIDTPIVEISDDGETAKGIWSIRGNHSRLTVSGPLAYWAWSWMAADFRKENNEWKIWHLLYLNELYHQCGSKVTGDPISYPEVDEFKPIGDFEEVKPNVSMDVRPLYSPNRPFMKPPRLPEPYDSFKNTFSYGI